MTDLTQNPGPLSLDGLAFAAAKKTFRDEERRQGDADEEDYDEDAALHEAISSYLVTAQVRGIAHGLPIVHGDVPGYEGLARVLGSAYDQSAKGKGKERHANARPFDKQPIMEIGRMLSSICDGELYQIVKKAQEASGMIARGRYDAAKAELLGAIVYSAAAVLLIEDYEQKIGEIGDSFE